MPILSRRVLATAVILLSSITVATPSALLAATPTRTSAPALERAPTPDAAPTPPTTLKLYRSAGFRYQDPNYVACTATSVMDMLNFMALGDTGGPGFAWSRSLSTKNRDGILAWERAHDTMTGGRGTDPHGWRNALNYYGWGSAALEAGSRIYDDFSFTSYSSAMKAAVRAMISTNKPVAMLAWAGRHAVMITGYDGLSGDPFAKDVAGRYTNTFTVAGFYLSDPLRQDHRRNVRVSYSRLAGSSDASLRFRRYRETDSPYDDRYTAGTRASRTEWYGKWVLILPVR